MVKGKGIELKGLIKIELNDIPSEDLRKIVTFVFSNGITSVVKESSYDMEFYTSRLKDFINCTLELDDSGFYSLKVNRKNPARDLWVFNDLGYIENCSREEISKINKLIGEIESKHSPRWEASEYLEMHDRW